MRERGTAMAPGGEKYIERSPAVVLGPIAATSQQRASLLGPTSLRRPDPERRGRSKKGGHAMAPSNSRQRCVVRAGERSMQLPEGCRKLPDRHNAGRSRPNSTRLRAGSIGRHRARSMPRPLRPNLTPNMAETRRSTSARLCRYRDKFESFPGQMCRDRPILAHFDCRARPNFGPRTRATFDHARLGLMLARRPSQTHRHPPRCRRP